VGQTHWRSSWRTVSCGRDLTLEQGKRVRRKEWQRQSVMNWSQTPFPIRLHCRDEGGREKSGGSWAREEERGGERCIKIYFYFSLSYSDFWLAVNLTNSASRVCFARDGSWWVISPCPYLDSLLFHQIYFSPVQLRRGSDREVLMGTQHPVRLNHNRCPEPLVWKCLLLFLEVSL